MKTGKSLRAVLYDEKRCRYRLRALGCCGTQFTNITDGLHASSTGKAIGELRSSFSCRSYRRWKRLPYRIASLISPGPAALLQSSVRLWSFS